MAEHLISLSAPPSGYVCSIRAAQLGIRLPSSKARCPWCTCLTSRIPSKPCSMPQSFLRAKLLARMGIKCPPA